MRNQPASDLLSSRKHPSDWSTWRSSIWFTVLACGFTLFTDTFLYSMAVPILPFALTQKTHIPEQNVQTWISILLAVHGAGIAVASPICAWWADHSATRKWPYLFGLVGLSSATVLLALSSSITMLVLGRLLQGLSGAVAWTVPLAIVTDRVTVDQVGPYLGYMTIGRSIGMSAGPLVGSLVFSYGGYLQAYIPAFSVLGVDMILRLTLVTARSQQVAHSQVCQARASQTLYLLTSRRMWAAIWGSFQSAFICGALDSVLPLFVLHTYGWGSMQAGGSFVALMGPSMISPMIGKLVPRLGARVSAVWGYLGSAVALGCLALVSKDTDTHKTLFVIFLILCGCSMVFFEIAAWVDAVTAAQTKAENQPHYITPGGVIAQVYGLTNVMFALGFVAGPLGAGLMYRRCGWTATVLLLACITFTSAIPTILWLERKSEVEELPTTLPVGSMVEAKESL